MKLLGNRGDTIVEVLIAIVVVSMVLGSAFILSNRNTKNTLQAQERGEALKYVESQIEQIKAKTAQASTAAAPFCFNKDGSGNIASPASPGSPCSFGSIPGGYNLNITKSTSGGFTTYTITANWNNALGSGQDQIIMYYKIT